MRFLRRDCLPFAGRIACLVCAIGALGCQPEKNPTNEGFKASAASSREIYDAIYLRGAKVGTSHSIIQPDRQDGMEGTKTEQVTSLKLRRFGQTTESKMRIVCFETADGRLHRLRYETHLGATKRVVDCLARENRLILTYHEKEGEKQQTIPWSKEDRGCFALENSLRARPMQPGEQRTLRRFNPVLDQVSEIQMKAIDREPTRLLDRSENLLRIHTTETLPNGQRFQTDYWCNSEGEVLKAHAELLDQITYRTTEELARSEQDPQRLDLGLDLVLRVEDRQGSLPGAERVVYELQFEGEDLSAVFADDRRQAVESIDKSRCRLTLVRSSAGTVASRTPGPKEADRVASQLIESDAPCIRELAGHVDSRNRDPLELALALQKTARLHMQNIDFTQVLATAAEACASGRGDCTEHAMLFAGLCRARGLPARVAIGLVYMKSMGGFAYHMWTEVWTGSAWIGLDATTTRGYLTASHIKLSHSSLEGRDAYSSFLPVLRILGRVKIEVIEIR